MYNGKVREIVYQKYIKTSARVRYAPPVCKRAQVQGMKESLQTIRGNEDTTYRPLDDH